MAAANILLHIGAGKCGSSAIQTALTQDPVLRTQTGRRVVYGVINNDGELIYGEELKRRPQIRGYHASANTEVIAALSDRQIESLRGRFDDADAETIVLSNEEWLVHGGSFQEVLKRIGRSVSVLAYVRPQVPYFNAAWWQWGAWQDLPLMDWIVKNLPFAQWSTAIVRWKSNPRVERLSVRPLPSDVIADLMNQLNVEQRNSGAGHINRGLPGPILRLYQRNRELRPKPNSSQIDFVLSRRLNLSGSTPWVIDLPTADFIIRETRAANLKLAEMLDSDVAGDMTADQQWWSADAFGDRSVEPWTSQALSVEELEPLCVSMILALLKLERDLLGK